MDLWNEGADMSDCAVHQCLALLRSLAQFVSGSKGKCQGFQKKEFAPLVSQEMVQACTASVRATWDMRPAPSDGGLL